MNEDDDEAPDANALHDYSDSDSDGGIMMKRSNLKRKLPSLRKRTTPRVSLSAGGMTIAMLPSTTLKCREETPETSNTLIERNHSFRNGNKPLPSMSQETLRPSKPSTRSIYTDVIKWSLTANDAGGDSKPKDS
jgi:hypothetical protein